MASTNVRGLRALTREVISAGPLLWEVGAARRACWLAQAMALLRHPTTFLGITLREELLSTCGLSAEMIEWALRSSLETFTEEALLDLDARCVAAHPRCVRARPGHLAVVVLAGNVFTAAARGLAIPLLFGWPVIAKASTREDVFAAMLELALATVDPELAAAFRAVSISSEDREGTQVLFEQADAASVYGSDQTMDLIRAQLKATVSFIPHGHGLGVAIIGKAALDSEAQATEVAQSLARDVAAYDQRGCLSPHAAWVVRGAQVSPARFSELVFQALGAINVSLPRGTLPLASASAQLSFRAETAMRGTLLEGDGFSVAHEPHGTLRAGPCYRNLLVLELDDERELPAQLAPLSAHLKCLGTAGIEDMSTLIANLPPLSAPRVCKLGEMQTPPLHALADGVPAWSGLIRLIDV